MDDYASSDSGSGAISGHSGYYSMEDGSSGGRRVSQVECIGFDVPRVSA